MTRAEQYEAEFIEWLKQHIPDARVEDYYWERTNELSKQVIMTSSVFQFKRQEGKGKYQLYVRFNRESSLEQALTAILGKPFGNSGKDYVAWQIDGEGQRTLDNLKSAVEYLQNKSKTTS